MIAAVLSAYHVICFFPRSLIELAPKASSRLRKRGPQRLAEIGMRDLDQRVRPLDIAEHCEVDRAILRHDVLHVMTRRGDPRVPPAKAGTMVDTRVPPTLAVDLRQRKLRPSGAATAPLTNDSWPPAPEYCRPPIASAATWPARSIDSAPLTLVRRGSRHSTDGPFTSVTGSMRTDGLPSSPAVEPLSTQCERRDGEPVVEGLPVRHLARLVQAHDAVRDHLGVDAEGATRLLGEDARDLVGDRPDAELEDRFRRSPSRSRPLKSAGR